MEELVGELRAAQRSGRSGRRRAGRRASPFAREADRARANRQAARPRQRLPRARRAGRLGCLRRPGSVGRDRDRHRRRRGPGVRAGRERRHGQGRLVLPADRQEAPAGAGGRRAEPPAVHLPRRLRRRLPAAAGRGLPRPRALRADLLQPGAHVREGDPADRGRDGLVHGRRRLRAGDERRDRDRARHRHHLHRRASAGEGGDRPGRDGGGARRRGRPRAALRRRRPLRDRRRARARDRPLDRAPPAPTQGAALGRRSAGGAGRRPGRAVRTDPRGPPPAAGSPRGDRANRGRQPLRRVQAALRRDARLRLRPHRGVPGRDPGQRRRPVRGVGAEGRALHRARRASARSRSSSCRTSPASWSGSSTKPAGSRGTAPSS